MLTIFYKRYKMKSIERRRIMLKEMILKAKELLRRAGVRDEEGQTLIEYALIVALISIAVIVILGLVGGQLNTIFTQIRDALT